MPIKLICKIKSHSLIVLVIFPFACLLMACSGVPKNKYIDDDPLLPMAKLLNYSIESGVITIETIGRGCTFYTSFTLVPAPGENALAVIQKVPDNCRMREHVVSLQYSFKHLGLDLERPVKVANTLEPSRRSLVSRN